jgi:hypothetical protein
VGSAVISQFFLPVSGLPLPLLAPRCSPRSFTRTLYKGDSGVVTAYQFIALPPPPLLHPLCAFELLHSPLVAAAVDAASSLRFSFSVFGKPSSFCLVLSVNLVFFCLFFLFCVSFLVFLFLFAFYIFTKNYQI